MKLSDYSYVYNAAAHFAAAEKYPEGLLKELEKPGAEKFEALCWTLAETAMQGELIRRAMGCDPRRTPDAEQFRLRLRAGQIRKAGEIVLEAIVKGLAGDEAGEEVDEVLQELQKKTGDD